MRPVLLAFGGKPRHGKSSAAEAITERFKARVLSISELIAAELGLKREEIKDLSVLQKHSHARCKRDCFYWARQIHRQAMLANGETQIVICPNLRRLDEAEYLAARGWHLARVIALNEDGSLYTPTNDGRDLNDPLETQLDNYNWDYRLISRKPGGLLWLRQQAIALAEYLLSGGEAALAGVDHPGLSWVAGSAAVNDSDATAFKEAS